MAGFVLANGSMSSNQSGEGKICKKLIEADCKVGSVCKIARRFTAPPGHLQKPDFRRLIGGVLAIGQCGGGGTVDLDEVSTSRVLWFARFSA